MIGPIQTVQAVGPDGARLLSLQVSITGHTEAMAMLELLHQRQEMLEQNVLQVAPTSAHVVIVKAAHLSTVRLQQREDHAQLHHTQQENRRQSVDNLWLIATTGTFPNSDGSYYK